MNINSRVIFNNPHFLVSEPKPGCLRVREAFQSDDIVRSIFTLLFLGVFWFANLENIDVYAPYEFLIGWRFLAASTVALMILYYIWYKGYVEFDNAKGLIKIKLKQHKYFRAETVNYEDIAGIQVKVSERKNNVGKTYFIDFFYLNLKSRERQQFLKVYRRKHERRIALDIANHIDIKITERAE